MDFMKPNEMSYEHYKMGLYPGYKLRGQKEFEKKLKALETKMNEDEEYLETQVAKHGALSKEALKAQGYFDKSRAAYERLKKALFSGAAYTKDEDTTETTDDLESSESEEIEEEIIDWGDPFVSGDAFVDQSLANRPYISTPPDFSLGAYVGRQKIDRNRVKLLVDHYTDYDLSQVLEKENDPAERKPLTDYLSVLNTDTSEAFFFDDILEFGAGVYEDNKDIMDSVFDAAHNRHIINVENKKALEILILDKTVVSVTSTGIQTAINSKLCGKAKRNAIIIVNKTGFAKLDIEVDGVSQVTRDGSGNMVYKNKYIIWEMPTEILPDSNGSSPVIIGDIRNVLKFFLIRDDVLFKDDIFPYTVADRRFTKEIITRTTTSDEAYFIGSLPTT